MLVTWMQQLALLLSILADGELDFSESAESALIVLLEDI